MLTGWKTLIFSAIVSLMGVLQSTNWVDLLGSQKAGLVVTGIGIVSAILRFMTTTPVGKSE